MEDMDCSLLVFCGCLVVAVISADSGPQVLYRKITYNSGSVRIPSCKGAELVPAVRLREVLHFCDFIPELTNCLVVCCYFMFVFDPVEKSTPEHLKSAYLAQNSKLTNR